ISNVIPILKISLEDENLLPFACDSWFNFIKTIGDEAGKYINQIIVILLPYLQTIHSEKIVKILEYLIIEKKDIINLQNIQFLTNIKPLEKINQFLTKTITDNTFEQTIEKILSGMKHENVNVRKLVISNLLDLIKNNQEKIIMNEFL